MANELAYEVESDFQEFMDMQLERQSVDFTQI